MFQLLLEAAEVAQTAKSREEAPNREENGRFGLLGARRGAEASNSKP